MRSIIIILILLFVLIFIVTYLIEKFSQKEGFTHHYSEKPVQMDSIQPYVINLKKNTGRLHDFTESYQKSDLGKRISAIRIDAIYGIDLPYKNYISPNAERKDLSPGMIGCFLSHLETYKQFLANSDKPYALIFEDDAKITDPEIYVKHISTIPHRMPADWDIVLLGYFNHDPEHKFETFDDYYQFTHFWGTHAYVIHRETAQKLLDLMSPPFSNQIDHQMSYLAKRGELKIYGFHEPCVIQGTPYSDVQTGR
jgi:GR25 family glycosyltransferase involved in LPS biosynthesis